MNVKVIVGIVLFIAGLGLGVWNWVIAGFTGEFPTIGLISTFIGLYFLISGLIELRRKKTTILGVTLPAGLGDVSDLALPLMGLALGKMAYEKVKEFYSSRRSKLTPEQIAALEAKLNELYAQGKIEPDKYYEAMKILNSLKRET